MSAFPLLRFVSDRCEKERTGRKMLDVDRLEYYFNSIISTLNRRTINHT